MSPSRPLDVEEVLAADALDRRPARAPEPESENRALIALAGRVSSDPEDMLELLADTVLELCRPAASAGVSLLSHHEGRPVFRWPAVSGRLAGQLHRPVPRDELPCGLVLDRGEPVLVCHPGRHYEALNRLDPPVVEAFLYPFRAGDRVIGTIWAVSHDEDARFDAEDLRLLGNLATVAAAGQQLQRARAGVDEMERLQEISTHLLGQDDVQGLLDEILDAAVDIMEAPMGTLQVLEPGSEALTIHAHRGLPPSFLGHFARVTPRSKASCGVALGTAERVIVTDVEEGVVFQGADREAMLEAGARAVQSTPMLSRSGELLGVISTYWERAHRPSRRRLRLLDILARQGADLIDRMRTERALREGERRYRTLFESIDEGFVIIQMIHDENGQPVDYRFVEVNPTFERHTGIEDAVGRTAKEAVPELEEEWVQIYGEVALTGEPTRFSYGSEAMGRWFDVFAFRIGDPEERRVALLFSDVTEQKRAEEEREALLRQVETEREHLSELFDNAPSFMCILHGPEHVFERTNELYRQLLGNRELVGKPIREALPEVEGQGFFDLLDRVYETGETYVGSDVRVELERGPPGEGPEERWLDFVYQPLREPDGSVGGVFVQGVDLTERKRAEDRLRESEQRLREVNARLEERVAARTAELEERAEELRRLTGQLATAEQRERRDLAQTLHDHLQQLLVAARMKVDTAVDRVEDPDTSARLREAIEHLDETLREIRTLATDLSPPSLYSEGLVPALEALVRRMEGQYGLTIALASHRVPEGISEDVRAFVFQAVRELTFNVVKHAEAERAWVDLRAEPAAEWLTVTVTDDGKGCDPETALEAREEGFGLRAIRERVYGLGGDLKVDRVEGGGLRVSMRVPLELAAAPTEPESEDRTEAVAAERASGERSHATASAALRVLLVDDHKIMREGLVHVLEGQPGIEVVGEASDGRQAVETVRDLEPDVVVMDVSMPEMDGVEATRAIKRQWPHVRVIGLSMNTSETTVTMMREAGAEAHLPKGGPSKDLVAAIKTVS